MATYTSGNNPKFLKPTDGGEQCKRQDRASAAVTSPVDETISVSYIEPFYCSQNLRCDDLLVPAGRRRRCEAARAAAPCAAASHAGLAVGSAEGGGGGGLLSLGLAAYSCGDGDWGRLRQLRLLPGCDGN